MSQGEGGGRPTKYQAAFHCKYARELSKAGFTEFEIARFFEVSMSTVTLWMGRYPKFSAALKLGKAPADKRVERSLFHRANGYSYESEELFQVPVVKEIPNADPKLPPTIIRTHEIIRVPVIKHVPPSDTALIFWLKNRRRDRWRDYKAVELTGDLRRPIGMIYEQKGPALLQDYYAKIAASATPAPADSAIDRFMGSDRSGDEEPDGDEDFSPR